MNYITEPSPLLIDLISLPPSPRGEGGMDLNINVLAPPIGRGFGVRSKTERGNKRG